MRRTVVVFSGGLDSTTLLYKASMTTSAVCYALGVDYGQRHRKELEIGRAHCEELGIQFVLADLSGCRDLLGGSSQTSDDVAVPHGHYADATMRATVVPNRNMIMAAIAIGYAVKIKANRIALGVHSGDHAVYPDCRPEFIEALRACARVANYEPVEVWTPFLHVDKTEIARQAGELGVPIEKTWSCYEGQEVHCGKCGTCVERIEAIRDAGLVDPTEYRERSDAA